MCFFILLWIQEEFEIAMLNEPSVFEPLKFYCVLHHSIYYSDSLEWNGCANKDPIQTFLKEGN